MKQKISIPETLNDLTLEQYQKFLKVVDGNTDELFIRKKMVQIFCNVPLIYVEHISKADFDDITTKIIEVLNQTPDLTIKFSLNNVEYGFIPSLEDDITLAEFVDLDNLTGNWEEMQQFMSILYRPIAKKKGNKYKIEPYKAKKFEDFKDMPLGIVIGSQLFFFFFRQTITTTYQQLWSKSTSSEGNTGEITEGFGSRWGWYASISELAGHDYTKIDGILKSKLHPSLFHLIYMKDKAETEAELFKKQRK